MQHIFGHADSVRVSRNDLREWARLENLDCVVMGTLLWGYSDGMRGNRAANIADNLTALTGLLGEAGLGIPNWKAHFEKVEAISGIGLSTYTKFLNFLSVSVSGKQHFYWIRELLMSLKAACSKSSRAVLRLCDTLDIWNGCTQSQTLWE